MRTRKAMIIYSDVEIRREKTSRRQTFADSHFRKLLVGLQRERL